MGSSKTASTDSTFLTSLIVVTIVSSTSLLHCHAHYTDQWAVHVKDSGSAEVVARDTNCIVEGEKDRSLLGLFAFVGNISRHVLS